MLLFVPLSEQCSKASIFKQFNYLFRFVLLEVQGLDTLEYGKQGREAEVSPRLPRLFFLCNTLFIMLLNISSCYLR